MYDAFSEIFELVCQSIVSFHVATLLMALATTPETIVTMVCVELEAFDEVGSMASYMSG